MDAAAMLIATCSISRRDAIAEAFNVFCDVHSGVMELEGGCMGNVHGIYDRACDPTMVLCNACRQHYDQSHDECPYCP
jgi:hypothetical protein